jgi:formylglycine-generating enzyme required for sulfatase activity
MKKIFLLVVLSLVLFGCATTLKLNERIIGEFSPLSPIETVTNPNMVLINGGTFRMGANTNSTGVQTTVESFYISKYEVTVGEFRRFINSTGYIPTGETYGYEVWIAQYPGVRHKNAPNPSWDNPYMEQDENHPVVLVSWYDAVEYCNWLSLQEGLTPAYRIIYTDNKVDIEWNRSANGYRLPTEAEWEYACRAGSTTIYYYGNTPDVNTGWYVENSNNTTHPVGTMPPNSWGLYDMQGNVSEWVQDWYSLNSVKLKKSINFHISVNLGRSNYRFGIQTFAQGWNDLGFRIARR